MSESYTILCASGGLATAVDAAKNYGAKRNIANWKVSKFGPFDPLMVDVQSIAGNIPSYAKVYTNGPNAWLVIGYPSGSGPADG